MNTMTVTVAGESCRLFHRWEKAPDIWLAQREACKDCTARRLLQPSSDYNSLDTEWLLAHVPKPEPIEPDVNPPLERICAIEGVGDVYKCPLTNDYWVKDRAGVLRKDPNMYIS